MSIHLIPKLSQQNYSPDDAQKVGLVVLGRYVFNNKFVHGLQLASGEYCVVWGWAGKVDGQKMFDGPEAIERYLQLKKEKGYTLVDGYLSFEGQRTCAEIRGADLAKALSPAPTAPSPRPRF